MNWKAFYTGRKIEDQSFREYLSYYLVSTALGWGGYAYAKKHHGHSVLISVVIALSSWMVTTLIEAYITREE